MSRLIFVLSIFEWPFYTVFYFKLLYGLWVLYGKILPRALASGLSPVQRQKHKITCNCISMHLHFLHCEIMLNIGILIKGAIIIYTMYNNFM